MNWFDMDLEKTIREYDYTRMATRNIERIVTSDSFAEMDSDRIYEYLLRGITIVSFKDYLKRYIYERAQFPVPFSQVTEQDFQQILEDNFRQNHAPHSFGETSKRLSQAVRGWLRQEGARRSTVFLLGFGLRMSVDDVSEFLVKVIQEEDFDFRDPEEVVYWYCFSQNLRYAAAKELLEKFQADEGGSGFASQAEHVSSHQVRDEQGSDAALHAVHDGSPACDAIANGDNSSSQEDLMSWTEIIARNDYAQNSRQYLEEYLQFLKNSGAAPAKNEDAFQEFWLLYDRARDTIAKIYAEDTTDLQSARAYTREDIGPSDIEKILLSGIPHTASGNLTKSSTGLLSRQFHDKRPERHRIDNILKRKALVDRFDLITLLFLVYAQEVEPDWPAERFLLFIDEMNAILERSHMLDLYPANPYEAFISMCLLSDSPLSVYADIWEMSYTGAGEQA